MVGEEVAVGVGVDEFPVEFVPIFEAAGFHSCGRADGAAGFLGEWEVHGAELRAEESSGGEGFDFLGFTHSFDALPDVDEGGHDGIPRAEDLGHPSADMGARNGLRRNVSGVPVVLVA